MEAVHDLACGVLWSLALLISEIFLKREWLIVYSDMDFNLDSLVNKHR